MDDPRFLDRTLVFTLLGAVLGWLAARFAWPWCGPSLLEPCPLPTPAGCVAAALLGAVWGLARGLTTRALP